MTAQAGRYFAADAAAHRRDVPRFCPRCAEPLGIATEFWEADERRFYCSCTGCGWTGEITPTGAVASGHEPEH
ncbi:MAG: hypothetical protein L0H64_14195 [Pseudonocardia sp.]|nr:hypothetical protein [Pseudonocardia sp.]